MRTRSQPHVRPSDGPQLHVTRSRWRRSSTTPPVHRGRANSCAHAAPTEACRRVVHGRNEQVPRATSQAAEPAIRIRPPASVFRPRVAIRNLIPHQPPRIADRRESRTGSARGGRAANLHRDGYPRRIAAQFGGIPFQIKLRQACRRVCPLPAVGQRALPVQPATERIAPSKSTVGRSVCWEQDTPSQCRIRLEDRRHRCVTGHAKLQDRGHCQPARKMSRLSALKMSRFDGCPAQGAERPERGSGPGVRWS